MDTEYHVDFAIMLRDRDGTVRVEHDRHVEGIFPRETWLNVLEGAGFEVSCRKLDPEVHETQSGFLCWRPG
jgi:hypothetical protein